MEPSSAIVEPLATLSRISLIDSPVTIYAFNISSFPTYILFVVSLPVDSFVTVIV